MATYTVHAGHAKDGNSYSGAAGYCKESVEDRLIKDAVVKYLRAAGHTVQDCTVDQGQSQSGIITEIKKKINSCTGATANISIHLNASRKASVDGKIKGVECEVYSNTGQTSEMANRICKKIGALGFTNRGVKERTDLGVLKGITNGGVNILVECFFCDDEDDYKFYQKIRPNAIGQAIAEGILNQNIKPQTGWIEQSEKWYFYYEGQPMTSSWIHDARGNWSYLTADGTAVMSGWQEIDCKWYYFDSNCYMQASEWIEYKGKWYYLQDDGSMATDCYIKSKDKDIYYWVNTDGVWMPEWNTSKPNTSKYRVLRG
ncbi:MAG: N-acetylmuramoyl-L-alanine amidase [Lachnospiraceae bacterium]|nr:N-acetylmuramoyl-L-alanine amidase [Lachnospiraceae bacterium]